MSMFDGAGRTRPAPNRRSSPRHSTAIRRILAAAAALAVIGTAAACSSSNGTAAATVSPGTSTKNLKPLVLGTSSSTVSAYSAAYAIGQYLGCYADQGYNMTLLQMNTPELLLAGLHSGKVDIGIPGTDQFESIVETVNKSGDPLPMKAFYEYTYPTKRGMAVDPSSSITSFQDLVGKTIGVDVLTDSSAPFLKAYFRQIGIDPNSVKYLAVGKGVAPGVALQTHKVDAVYLDDSQLGQMLQAGMQLRFLTNNGEKPYINASGIAAIATEQGMQADPGKFKAFARCAAEGAVFTGENPTAAAYIMLQMFPTLGTPGKPLEDQLATIVLPLKIRQPLLHSKDASVPYGQMNSEEFTNDLTLVLGQSADALDVSSLYTNDLIAYANQFDPAAIKKQADEFQVPGITGQVKTVDLPPNVP